MWAWAEKELGTIHIIQLHVEPPNAKRPIIVPFTIEEIRLLLAGCEFMTNWDTGNDQRTTARRPTATLDKAMLFALLDAGLRVSELCQLRLSDYDQRRGQLFIQRGKGDKERVVYLGDTARKHLWRYLTSHRESAKLDDPLFISREGSPLDRHAIRLLIRRLGDRVGVRGTHPHKFRHTFAINFLRNGGNLFALQAALGHAKLDTVKIYAKLAETDLEQISKQASVADRWKL